MIRDTDIIIAALQPVPPGPPGARESPRQDHDTWNEPEAGSSRDDSRPSPFGAPPQQFYNLTTLGRLKAVQDPKFPYWEWVRLNALKDFLTDKLHILLGRRDHYATHQWLCVMDLVDLDRRARVDLMLLAQAGLPGRTEANKILWSLMAEWAVDPSYRDLSAKVTSACGRARLKFDRPPRNHWDNTWWGWSHYTDGCNNDPYCPKNIPDSVGVPCGPQEAWQMVPQLGPHGEPQPPPWAWKQVRI